MIHGSTVSSLLLKRPQTASVHPTTTTKTVNVTVLNYVWMWHDTGQDVWLLCNTHSKGLVFVLFLLFFVYFVRRITFKPALS